MSKEGDGEEERQLLREHPVTISSMMRKGKKKFSILDSSHSFTFSCQVQFAADDLF